MAHKWNRIREKIASNDAGARSIYEKFGREIYAVAKRGEPDPEPHRSLKAVLDRAKTYNVPQAMIDRALEKAQGGSEEIYEEIRFEGFGGDGTKVIVEALTRNVNRTASEVRDAFEMSGISLGESGSVDYMFDAMGVIGQTGLSFEEAYELLSDSPVRDYYFIEEDDTVIILCPLEEFHVMQEVLQNAGAAEFTMVEQTMEAQHCITLPAYAKAQFESMINALENLEEVQQVYHNVDLDEEDQEEVIEPSYIMSDEEQAVFSTIISAIEQVKRYSYEGSMTLTGPDTDLIMFMEGDIHLKPEFALHSKSSFQSGDKEVEQEIREVQGKAYSRDHITGEWIVSEGLGESAAQESLTKYFSRENVEAIQDIQLETSGSEIRIEIEYDVQKYDRIVQKHRTAPKTVAAKQHFKINSTTMLPTSALLEMESDDGDGIISLNTEITYTYNGTSREIVPPIG
ncbi:hypothetical protein PM3016_3569 [Paenibacillus mucilaginosus 3016]|uniref:Probable transcriptional regulatory protein PM3016_3569 n=2 Tax=Paenibacillus mucilaginosus TaxID=61624 RepID=H6NMQ3_9BACL|nr:hypothetical protein PM3016_3569 [Paenibacillus mucilaginosus 3016]AFH62666.1 hypothetical protein B2K_18390 [Paenibacillus mucilaginosus K02]WFA19028.1 YebC/PmpR family DNA-binding transcriptional regulator [Paenibacillus mucilaginosus]